MAINSKTSLVKYVALRQDAESLAGTTVLFVRTLDLLVAIFRGTLGGIELLDSLYIHQVFDSLECKKC